MALIPPAYFDCVAAIGVRKQAESTRWVATGFLYGKVHQQLTGGKKVYKTYLVTNRHVASQLTDAVLRFNPKEDAPAREFYAPFSDPEGKPFWRCPRDPSIDVAVIPLNVQRLSEEGIAVAVFDSDDHCAQRSRMKELGVSEGDFVYVLGFPFGDVGGYRNHVVARSGSIARVGDSLSGSRPDFLLDALTFPGNSGGPVISRPELGTIPGTKALNRALLIGVIAGSISYVDEAVSTQTNRTRVTFEDNSGLSTAFPVDYIEEAIAAHLATVVQDTP